MAYTNAQIVPAAVRGLNAETPNGNFSTRRNNGYIGYRGNLPHKISKTLDAFVGRITQSIYSYSTPIAVCIDGVWIVPDVTYSITTSAKHASQLYMLGGFHRVPWDATVEDVERIIAGQMKYVPSSDKIGRYVAA
jgi:uncharacterized RmlC-like cupin family protein